MEKEYHNALFNQLLGYRNFATRAEYNELINDANKLRKEIKQKSIKEQHKIFSEEYGELVDNILYSNQMQLLRKMNGTLNFFKVLAIIGLIGVIIQVIVIISLTNNIM